jgi:hypothetical protein
MTPQERNLLIAEAMGWKIYQRNPFLKFYYFIEENNKKEFICEVKNWNPSSNPEQREMIKAKLREWGYGYDGGYDCWINSFWFRITQVEMIIKVDKLSESEAFLEAVGELCLTLKIRNNDTIKK